MYVMAITWQPLLPRPPTHYPQTPAPSHLHNKISKRRCQSADGGRTSEKQQRFDGIRIIGRCAWSHRSSAESVSQLMCHRGRRCSMGPVGHGLPKILVGWATMHLAPLIIGLFSLFLALFRYIYVKLVKKKQIFVAITASCGFCDKLPTDRSHNH